MFDFLRKLFDTSDFPERWHCGSWTPAHGWLHIISDTLIFGAYAAIPVAIGLVALRRREDIGFPKLYWLFAGFILLCGLGHLVEATLFWHPWYRLSGLVKACTAVTSWATVATLVRYVPMILTLPAATRLNEELKREVDERRRLEARAQQLNRDLAARVQELETLLEVLPIGIGIALDPQCQTIRTNRAFSGILGIEHGRNASLSAPSADAPPGFKICRDGKELPADELPIQRAARDGIEVRDFEQQIARDDGQRIDVLCQAAPIFDEHHLCRGAVGVFYDITERKAAEDKLKNSLREKQVLLHEVHHRVKNNLQFIISLLRLQSAEVNDPLLTEVLEEMRCRVHAMALVHEKLYRAEDFSRLDYASYLRELVSGVSRSMSKRAANIGISVEADPEGLETNAAVPVGFIVNELVAHCLKNSFADGGGGRVEVTLHGSPQQGFELVVRDNGTGVPEDFDPAKAPAMGWRLVMMLVRQIGGTLTLNRGDGVEFAIKFSPRQNH